MVSGLGRPQTEAVVVFHHGDAALHAGLLCGFEPLARIGSCGGIEVGVCLTAIAPLGVGIGVHAVMVKGIELRFVPLQLAFRRNREHRPRGIFGVIKHLLLQGEIALREQGGREGQGPAEGVKQ